MTALDETTTFNEDADSLLILKSMSRPHQAKIKPERRTDHRLPSFGSKEDRTILQ
jgi:hypothetical protein